MYIVKKACDIIERILVIILGILLTLMVIFIFSQVFARFVLNSPLSWTEEFSRHLMIWMVFLASAVAYRKGAHLKIDILENQLGKKKRIILDLVFLAMLIIFLINMFYYGAFLVEKTYHQRSSAFGYPMSFIYASIPTSAILMMIFSAEKILELIVELLRKGGSSLAK
ncbi:MAG: TRAP transporter small permease [Thermotoga sp.]|nr:MAG: TRAP transporter small permease [Thermotoga sp.]